MITPRKIVLVASVALAAMAAQVFSAGGGGPAGRGATPADNTPRTFAPYFTPAAPAAKAPDPEGFLQRWLLLEPINKPNRSNAVFTEDYVKNAFKALNFPDQFTAFPHSGDKATVSGEQLAWHALDSTN